MSLSPWCAIATHEIGGPSKKRFLDNKETRQLVSGVAFVGIWVSEQGYVLLANCGFSSEKRSLLKLGGRVGVWKGPFAD